MRKEVNKILRILHSWLFNLYFYSKLRKRRHVVICGDSHTSVFKYITKKRLLKSIVFDIITVGGATAQGMVNPNSKTNALNIFLNRISKMKRWQEVWFQLGEVDCGFVIWYYSEKFNIPIEEQVNRSITNYKVMIEKVQRMGIKKITVMSAPLPTIQDGQTWGEIANARKEVKATLIERTTLTLKYNERLKEMSKTLGITFLDITSKLLDKNKNVIDKKYLNPNKLDHHLCSRTYSLVIINELSKVIFKK